MSKTPWKTENWHTSPWNFAPEVTADWKFPEKIQIHDVTLRDGEQQAGLAFNYDDKIRIAEGLAEAGVCLLYTSPSPRDLSTSRMPSSA